MSLLKKLFGKAEAPRAQTPRSARVKITPLHRIEFALGSVSHPLSNISVGGLGLMHVGVAGSLKGVVKIGDEKFEVALHVRHVGSEVTGCEFEAPTLELKRAIQAYLKVEIQALDLRKVDPAFLKADPRGPVVWFTDGKQNEVYCVSDTSGVLAFHMNFVGNYVEWERSKGLRAGTIRDSSKDFGKHKGSDLLDLTSLTEETLGLARIFVQNVETMNEDLRAEIQAVLTSQPTSKQK